MAVSKKLRAAAEAAAQSNAQGWVWSSGGKPLLSDEEMEVSFNDDIHVDEFVDALGRAMTPREHRIMWPIYLAALRAKVDALLAKGAS